MSVGILCTLCEYSAIILKRSCLYYVISVFSRAWRGGAYVLDTAYRASREPTLGLGHTATGPLSSLAVRGATKRPIRLRTEYVLSFFSRCRLQALLYTK